MALRITLVKSPIGYAKDQRATVVALGLRKIGQSVLKEDTPPIRGMAHKVRHLVTVTDVEGGADTEAQ